jgi:hypothetical protein
VGLSASRNFARLSATFLYLLHDIAHSVRLGDEWDLMRQCRSCNFSARYYHLDGWLAIPDCGSNLSPSIEPGHIHVSENDLNVRPVLKFLALSTLTTETRVAALQPKFFCNPAKPREPQRRSNERISSRYR